MWNALDINSKAIIATAATRKQAAALAEKIVGKEGYCVRPAVEAPVKLPKNWATSDGQWWI